MDRLEGAHEIEPAGQLRVGGVAHLEGGPVSDPGGDRVGASFGDGRLVEVQAGYRGVGIPQGDGDAGPAGATADVSHSRRRVSGEALHEAGDLGEPLLGQQVQEQGPVEAGDAVAQLRPVGLVGHTGAGAKRVEHLGQRLGDTDEQRRQRGHERQAVVVGQHLGMRRWEPVHAGVRTAGNLDGDNPGHRLVVEPLCRVPLVDLAPLGQPGGAQRPRRRQRPIQAQAIADMHVQQVEPTDARPQQPLHQSVAPESSVTVIGPSWLLKSTFEQSRSFPTQSSIHLRIDRKRWGAQDDRQ